MTTTDDFNPIENGVQQAYQEIRSAVELILCDYVDDGSNALTSMLADLDDAVSNNWDELMTSFWLGVQQDIDDAYPLRTA